MILELVPRLVPLKKTVAPLLIDRLSKVKVGVPAVLRVTVMVPWPEETVRAPKVWTELEALLRPLRLSVPPARVTAGRFPSEPKRLAVYPLATLSSIYKVPARLMVIVSEDVMLGAVKPPVVVANGLTEMRSVPESTMMLPVNVLPAPL